MTSDPQVSALLWIGLAMALVVGVMMLVPLWQAAYKSFQDRNILTTFLFPLFLTVGLGASAYLITLGGTKTAQNFHFENVAASKPKAAFVEQVKADDAALTPQTKAALEAERDALKQQVSVLQKQVLDTKAKASADGYQDFRKQFEIPKDTKE